MKPIIGFCGDGHLGQHSSAAARAKGFLTSTKFNECDIVYICPDRPGDISPEEMVELALPHLKHDAVLVIHCQVIPGFTRKIKWPNIYYHVETLRMSDAQYRALNPERIIIGYDDGKLYDNRLTEFIESFNCPIINMSYESAELTKIALNIYLAAQVSTTNTLSEIAKKIGANWQEIIPALQTDSRIGKDAYLQPGYGLSKHLLRDLETIHAIGGNTKVTDAFFKHSEYRRMLGDSAKS